MTNKSLRRESLKKSLRKKKLRVSNKRNSSSRKKGGSSLKHQKVKAGVNRLTGSWLSRGLHYLDVTKFFDSTKRLEIRKNGIQLIKELGIADKLGIDCGCLTNDDCSDGNICNLYKNQCAPKEPETIEKKNERRMNQVLGIIKNEEYDFLFEGIDVFFDEINKKLNSKMAVRKLITVDSLADFITSQRSINKVTSYISRNKIEEKLRDYYQMPNEDQIVASIDEILKNQKEIDPKGVIMQKLRQPYEITIDKLTQSSLFSVSTENMGAIKTKLGEKLPTIISKTDLISRIKTPEQDLNEISVDILSPELMSQLENINKNIISRKCLFDSFTSGDKFPFGVLIPCILLTFDWSNFINKFSSFRYLASTEELEKIEELKNIDKVDFKNFKSPESLSGGGQKKNQRNQIGGDFGIFFGIVFIFLVVTCMTSFFARSA